MAQDIRQGLLNNPVYGELQGIISNPGSPLIVSFVDSPADSTPAMRFAISSSLGWGVRSELLESGSRTLRTRRISARACLPVWATCSIARGAVRIGGRSDD